MKLYDATLSPFAARVRVQIFAKSLDIPLIAAPGGAGSNEYKRINPTGDVPALVLDDGSVLPESLVIGEFLEDRFHEPSLRPADAVARAQMRLVTHFADGYVEPPLHAMFPQVTDPAARDPKLIAEKTAELATCYDQLVRFLTPGGPYDMGKRPGRHRRSSPRPLSDPSSRRCPARSSRPSCRDRSTPARRRALLRA